MSKKNDTSLDNKKNISKKVKSNKNEKYSKRVM